MNTDNSKAITFKKPPNISKEKFAHRKRSADETEYLEQPKLQSDQIRISDKSQQHQQPCFDEGLTESVVDPEEDDEDEDESALRIKIQSVKRKRHLLGKIQAIHRASRRTDVVVDVPLKDLDQKLREEESNKDFRERLQGTFAGKKYADSSKGDFADDDDEDGEEGGILRQKQKLAMEQFIQQQLAHSSSNLASKTDPSIMADTDVVETEETSVFNPLYQQREADVGVGGAVLGGTGIAEVTLPVDFRIHSIQETEKALNARRHGYNQSQNNTWTDTEIRKLLPLSFGEGVSKKRGANDGPIVTIQGASDSKMDMNPKRLISLLLHHVEPLPSTLPFSASSAGGHVLPDDVSNLGRSYSHDFRLHNQEWIQNKRELQQKEVDAQKKKDEASSFEADSDRVGFDNLRKHGEGRSGFHSQTDDSKFHSSNDDRIWKNFVSKTRDSRK
jgi:hypothetical protein